MIQADERLVEGARQAALAGEAGLHGVFVKQDGGSKRVQIDL
jgi:hypothetical protein